MKHVFEFYGKPQVSFTGRAYSGRTDEPPKWIGMRVEGLMVDVRSDGKEGDAVFIEGDLAAVRRALMDAVSQLDMVEEWERNQKEAEARRSRQCAKCQRFYDPRLDWHGDGEGNKCYGSGEMRRTAGEEDPDVE